MPAFALLITWFGIKIIVRPIKSISIDFLLSWPTIQSPHLLLFFRGHLAERDHRPGNQNIPPQFFLKISPLTEFDFYRHSPPYGAAAMP
ncbi:MAG: hypothetical protein A2048_01460 [Deltaproteobacteria bacterium GWA2_45_12]|nr:MAG: hypothetical protein A2048_01460 [Deltaproteobacteria bacterium GWA2_45_12]